jgi:hypothetical protein
MNLKYRVQKVVARANVIIMAAAVLLIWGHNTSFSRNR